MSVNGENHKLRADALRQQSFIEALDGIESGEITLKNAVRRLRLQYSRAWREHERPYFESIANAYAKSKRRIEQ